jgi:spore germination protein
MLLRAALLAVFLLSSGAPAQANQRHVLGYYVPYDATSWKSLEAHSDAIDLLGAQWVTIDACGGLSSRDDQTLKQSARAHGQQVLPSLLTLSGWLNHRLLTEEDVSVQALGQIVNYTLAETYPGFDLDLEAVDPADRDALTIFVQQLSTALHEQGKVLTLAIPAKDRDVTVGWAGAYDYAALGASADLVTIMAYEYRGPFSGPGSVAPYDWVDRVLSFATAQIPPEKVLLGVAFYGYDWNTTSGGARSVGYPLAAALAERYAAAPSFDPVTQSATFGYTVPSGEPAGFRPQAAAVINQVTVRQAPPCGVVPPSPQPVPTRAPTPVPDVPQSHEVWFEDGTSAAARFGLADRYAVGGVSAWRLGLEDPQVWQLLRDWRR